MKKEIKKFSAVGSYLILGLFLILTLFVCGVLYANIQNLFKNRLQERIISIASTASALFSVGELDMITGEESIGTEAYEAAVRKLQTIRNKNKNVKYVYILRKTENPDVVEFVADADSLDPYAVVDLNGDGTIDEMDELNAPGDEYDISEFPLLKENAFQVPTVDDELAIDQWGTFLSASAPIDGSRGVSSEFIGIDVEVSDFSKIVNLALAPFVLFLVFLLLILISQTVFLVRFWTSRVDFLRDLDRQKDELISIVSHQLATPVSSIKWYLEMMNDGDLGALNKEQKEHVTSMQSIGENLADLVSMILDVSRIQLGRMHVEKQEMDLDDFFKEILEVIEPKALEKKVNLEKKLPAKLPKAMLDKRYTRMTIENLLSNAVKYTPENGRVQLNVDVKEGMLHCSVKDTGMGIPKAEQEKIFGKMFRASNVRNTVDGNGFGLYVAKGSVEAQGGKIWFESEEGKGTTFFVVLPLK